MNTDKDVFKLSYICVYLRSSVDLSFYSRLLRVFADKYSCVVRVVLELVAYRGGLDLEAIGA